MIDWVVKYRNTNLYFLGIKITINFIANIVVWCSKMPAVRIGEGNIP